MEVVLKESDCSVDGRRTAKKKKSNLIRTLLIIEKDIVIPVIHTIYSRLLYLARGTRKL